MADNSHSFERRGMEGDVIWSLSTKQNRGDTFNKIKTGDKEYGNALFSDLNDHAEGLNKLCAGPSLFAVF